MKGFIEVVDKESDHKFAINISEISSFKEELINLKDGYGCFAVYDSYGEIKQKIEDLQSRCTFSSQPLPRGRLLCSWVRISEIAIFGQHRSLESLIGNANKGRR